MEFALRQPARSTTLIVEDMAPPRVQAGPRRDFSAMMLLDLDTFQTRQQIEEALAPTIHSLVMRRFLLKNLGRDKAGKFYWKINLRGLVDNYPHLNAPIDSDSSFAKPTLFIRGGKSNHIIPSDEPGIHKLFPKANIQTIPEAGHWVHGDAPQEFIECVLKFLQPHLFLSEIYARLKPWMRPLYPPNPGR